MSEHTKAPWEVINGVGIYSALGADSGDGLKCASNDGWHIAEIADTPANVDGFGEVELGQAVKEANARHIVHCVNNHERLVEALRKMIAAEDCSRDAPGVLFDAAEDARTLLAALEAEKGG